MSTSVAEITKFLEIYAPPFLSESWDNTGLLLGCQSHTIDKVMTCLTLTQGVADEAIARKAGLVITHHPIPFKPIKQITSDSATGKILWDLASHKVNVFSPHTCFDSAKKGVNWQLATAIGLQEIRPLKTSEPPQSPTTAGRCPHQNDSPECPAAGQGRIGNYPHARDIDQIASDLKKVIGSGPMKFISSDSRQFSKIAIGCGSAGEFLNEAGSQGAQLLILGETTFHTCLAAQALGVSLLLVGHYRSERFALIRLADDLATHFSNLEVWASENDTDPIAWI